MRRAVSPLNALVWGLARQVFAVGAAAWLLNALRVPRHWLGVWALVAVLGFAWFTAMRLLFLEVKARTFWAIWLAVAALFLVLLDYPGRGYVLPVVLTGCFLLFRRGRPPLRHLTSKQQTWVFLAFVFLFLLLTTFWSVELPAAVKDLKISPFPGLGLNLFSYSLWALRFFLLFASLSLFFRIRLQFMKIKPKLVVSGLLFAAVPALLIIIMGLLVLYSVLGESRAVGAAVILRDWGQLAAKDERVLTLLSAEVYRYSRDAGAETTTGPETPFLAEIVAGLKGDKKFLQDMAQDSEARFFLRGEEMWLLRAGIRSGDRLFITAARVDRALLDRVARLVRADVLLSASNPMSLESLRRGTSGRVTVELKKERYLVGFYAAGEPTGPEPSLQGTSLWQKRFTFGMTHLDVVMLDQDGFHTYQVLLILKSSVTDIWSDAFSRRNPMGTAFLAVLVAMAGLMGVLELLTLVLGMRITKGITSAVKALDRGTRRIAAGDFETKTVVENEDELGDLAHAFNEMAAAVKRGREEAVRRQTIERELFVAREIQERLLPHAMPRVAGFEISGTSVPSQHVGGDYFDFLEMPSGRLGVAIADVSGKGIPAALLMANLQASLHGQALESGDAALIVCKINNLLARSTDSNMFATFFYGILDRILGEFTYTNAGHNPPLLIRADGAVERLEPCGLILGFMMDQAYDQRTVKLEPGDILVLFTDGITEAVRPGAPAETKYFGEERLLQAILAGASGGATEVQKAVLTAVASHTGEAAQEDDITLVVIKRRTDEPGPAGFSPVAG